MLGIRSKSIRDHSAVYWLLALLSIGFGMYLSHRLDTKHAWIEARYDVYRLFTWMSPNQRKPKHTVLVTLDDAQYWTGPLERRVPIKRDYLAKIVKALDTCNPSTIALDFDLESPTPDGRVLDNRTYQENETPLFVSTVLEISKSRAIVLPVATRYTGRSDLYLLDSAVYGHLPFIPGGLQQGYINLPFDTREIPTPQRLAGGGMIDSFSFSIVRANYANVLQSVGSNTVLPFGTFLERKIPDVKASDVLAGRCGPLAHKIAIVVSAWHQYAENEGNLVDLHLTPLGNMTGGTIHANYVEALIDGDTHKPLPKVIDRGIDFLTAAAFAILLATKTNRRYQKFCIVLLACIGLLILSYIVWQNLGYYFDFFFPVFFLLVHAAGHAVLELWKDSSKLHDLRRQGWPEGEL